MGRILGVGIDLVWGGVDLLELGAAKRPDETQGNGSRTAPT